MVLERVVKHIEVVVVVGIGRRAVKRHRDRDGEVEPKRIDYEYDGLVERCGMETCVVVFVSILLQTKESILGFTRCKIR